jgi:hypothetical protein
MEFIYLVENEGDVKQSRQFFCCRDEIYIGTNCEIQNELIHESMQTVLSTTFVLITLQHENILKFACRKKNIMHVTNVYDLCSSHCSMRTY